MLELKKIVKYYGKKRVLNGINFEIKEGELVCILGPSGCGKSTILNIIGGFVGNYDGEVVLEKKCINNLEPENRPIVTVFQSYGLFPHKNVIENISYGLKFLGISKEEILLWSKEILAKVGLSGYENKKISQLSGGEKQRVAIARSLVLKPKILLLDEPFANLDANLRVEMRNEIKKLQKEFNIATIFVTHDQEDAFRIADRIVLLNDGKIEQIGVPREIYNNPKNDFVANFIGNSNRINGKYIRPEKVKIFSSNNGKGVIVEKNFGGMLIEYVVKIDNTMLKSIQLSSEPELELGEYVEVKILD